jgi:hypothetical protein
MRWAVAFEFWEWPPLPGGGGGGEVETVRAAVARCGGDGKEKRRRGE